MIEDEFEKALIEGRLVTATRCINTRYTRTYGG